MQEYSTMMLDYKQILLRSLLKSPSRMRGISLNSERYKVGFLRIVWDNFTVEWKH